MTSKLGWYVRGALGLFSTLGYAACSSGEIPIGEDAPPGAGGEQGGSGAPPETGGSSSGKAGSGSGGSGGSAGSAAGSGGSGVISPLTCGDVRSEIGTVLASIQSCSADAECGQELHGTSCGCTRNLVARLDADISRFERLNETNIDGEYCAGFGSTCDCPAADGFACVSGRCTWNYLDTSKTGCEPQDAHSVGTCEPIHGWRWNGEECEIVSGCSCEGDDCDALAPTMEACFDAYQALCVDGGDCNALRRSMRDFINQHKSCETVDDCETHYAGCGVTEDDCTGAVYTNHLSGSEDLFTYNDLRLNSCVVLNEDEFGCALCERAATGPACVNGLCVGAGKATCELEASALRYFDALTDACTTDDDCTIEYVGCEVTEDDCTGAVYLGKGHDTDEFAKLRDEYYACKGSNVCDSCPRLASPPACVDGHCRAAQ